MLFDGGIVLKKKMEYSLKGMTLVILIFTGLLVYHEFYRDETEQRILELTGEVTKLQGELNNVKEAIFSLKPNEPTLDFMAYYHINGSANFIEGLCNILYESCQFNLWEDQTYYASSVWVRNEGIKANNLNIELDCPSEILPRGIGLRGKGEILGFSRIYGNPKVRFDEIDKINDGGIFYIYKFYNEQPLGEFNCKIIYSSDEISGEGEINIKI